MKYLSILVVLAFCGCSLWTDKTGLRLTDKTSIIPSLEPDLSPLMPPVYVPVTNRHYEVILEAPTVAVVPCCPHILVLSWNCPSNTYEEVLCGPDVYSITNLYAQVFTGNGNVYAVQIFPTNPIMLFRIYQPSN